MSEDPCALIVVGASAGGVEALRSFVAALPPDLRVPVAVVLHLSPTAPSVLSDILGRSTQLPVVPATRARPLLPGQIVVAIPDHHLCIEDGVARLSAGAKENGHRPAVDALFRSATRSYGSATVGVLLSGSLDDGVAGLREIRDAGGATLVQDPREAGNGSMPQRAIDAGVAQHVASVAELARLSTKLATEGAGSNGGQPSTPAPLVAPAEPTTPSNPPGQVSALTCPNCGGALWESSDELPVRYQCRTGHSLSSEALLGVQADRVDDALWGAYRSLLEQADLHRRMARRMEMHPKAAARHADSATRALQRAEVLRASILEEDPEEDPLVG